MAEDETGVSVTVVGEELGGLAFVERVHKIGSLSNELMTQHVEKIESDFASKNLERVEKRDAVAKLSTSQQSPVDASNVIPSGDEASFFARAQALIPPYDPGVLVSLFEHSNALRPNVDAYATNVDLCGHRFDPVLDLDASDVDEKIGDAMFLERLHASAGEAVPQAAYPTPDEIANRKKEITAIMRLERAKLDTFFEESVPDSSFAELREKTRNDLEITGNAFWEVLRNGKDEISQFTHAPAHSVRLLPLEAMHVEVRMRSRVSPITYEHTTQLRRFRRYVQIIATEMIYFKELGDPRVLNSRTGVFYKSVEEMRKDHPAAVAATEMVHFAVHSSRTPYGVPRWMGNLLSVLGSRASEEVNYLYFDNKAIPPMAVLVSGGKLAAGAKATIETYVQNQLKGRTNFHKILIIEAESAAAAPGQSGASHARIELKPLGDTLQQDALFQGYDERNIDKIGAAFRNPRIIRGDLRDFNRATADAALRFAEMQVYQPLRTKFDTFMNRSILARMNVRFWTFASNSPITKDPEVMSKIVVDTMQAGAVTPGEAREVLGRDVFNRDLKKIDADWTKQPIQLTVAGVLPAVDDLPAGAAMAATTTTTSTTPATPADRQLAAVAANLAALRDKLRGAEAKTAASADRVQRRAEAAEDVVVIPVPKAMLDTWVTPETEE